MKNMRHQLISAIWTCIATPSIYACTHHDTTQYFQSETIEPIRQSSHEIYIRNTDLEYLWPTHNIPVCLAYSAGTTAVPLNEREPLANFVKERIYLTWGHVLPLTITWDDCPTSESAEHVVFDLSWRERFWAGGTVITKSSNLLGSDLLTKAEDRPDITTSVGAHTGISSTWNDDNDNRLIAQMYILHEFGHVLGFQHEFIRPDSTQSCGFVPDTTGIGRSFGTYDPQSIMLSSYTCDSQLQSHRWLSLLDVAGARENYGTRIKPNANKDILWQDNDGTAAIWKMSGSVRMSRVVRTETTGTSWKALGTGDFNGDGVGDIFWQNASGATAIWLMNTNGTISSQSWPLALNSNWQFHGIGRADGNVTDDIVWRNTSNGTIAIWFMSGGTIGSTQYVSGPVNHWSLNTVADFNGDGKVDLFWRNTTSNATAVWLMNGATVVSEHWPMAVGAEWQVGAQGDLNGDGKADLFWKSSSGATAIWFMNGGTIQSQASPGPVDSGWVPRGAGDLNNDGRADILWTTGSGDNHIWFMNGAAVQSKMPLPPAGTSWHVKGFMRGALTATL